MKQTLLLAVALLLPAHSPLAAQSSGIATPASVTVLPPACPPAVQSPPVLTPVGCPVRGQTFELTVAVTYMSPGPAFPFPVLAIGEPLGFPFVFPFLSPCGLESFGEIAAVNIALPMADRFLIPIPNNTALDGLTFMAQALLADAGAPIPVVLSNGVLCRIGIGTPSGGCL